MQTGALCLESPGQQRSKVLGFFDEVGVPYEEGTRRRLRHVDRSRSSLSVFG
ncbi:MAG: hypothetical protein L0H79_16820 [Intrasporangium sp.]|uniref:hypothetical protein n=1 Tax=Intrasporangium sp. TaxID=1925024 RepID=UPI00264851C3|nr:hypothetical protein [Intrasporangium sp.]MDN5797399.1 hypothetical protein [Intrasporangium sp.]